MKKTNTTNKSRWLAFIILCLGTLMEVIDSTIVTVALPSIRSDLHFSEASLAWVVNAYLLTFGGFLLLGGRLGDLYGQRRLFLIGIAIFTIASLACGFAESQNVLIVARAVQGIGGAITAAVSLSLIMNLFPKPDERTKAMGYFGFIAAGGGTVGELLGGFLTNSFNWHWNFLINIPIGVLVLALSLKLLPINKSKLINRQLDISGAVTVTVALLLAVYAIVNGNASGWLSFQTIGLLVVSVVLLVLFVFIEKRVKAPLMPLNLFQSRNITTANIIAILWAAAMFAWFFLCALYLQLVLKYNPFQVGLAFLPADAIIALCSVSISAKIVMKYGIKKPIAVGLFLAAIGLALFVRAPVDGNFIIDVLPSMILLGIGAGIAFNPMFLAAMNDVKPSESGLASGIVNTSFMMGGALGLAILASVAASRTSDLILAGNSHVIALNSGYHAAFFFGAIFSVVAALLGIIFLEVGMPTPEQLEVH